MGGGGKVGSIPAKGALGYGKYVGVLCILVRNSWVPLVFRLVLGPK